MTARFWIEEATKTNNLWFYALLLQYKHFSVIWIFYVNIYQSNYSI